MTSQKLKISRIDSNRPIAMTSQKLKVSSNECNKTLTKDVSPLKLPTSPLSKGGSRGDLERKAGVYKHFSRKVQAREP